MLSEVIEKNEPMVNDIDVELDELCTTMIAKYQPTAKDLRIILIIFSILSGL